MVFRKLTNSRPAVRLTSASAQQRGAMTTLSAAMMPLEQVAPPIVKPEVSSPASSEERTIVLSSKWAEPYPKVQVFLSAALPAPGFSSGFDGLCGQYRRTKALQMILRRAFDDYEVMLLSASLIKPVTPYPIEEPLSLALTSRMMPRRVVEIALAHFDPWGVESMRAFGRKLASAALGMFFENERKGIGDVPIGVELDRADVAGMNVTRRS
ncbi:MULTISPECIES: VirC2 family conjugal transfer protein [unclassified Bradyrhizobium]|uniref:VirC2 family conjugal transfer protein n=1 Tax=unclassified Bradyrhizobium TaxID=2631580 RepID=UPI0013EEE736|nr:MULTISPECIES: VirC2 family conjugal transfer protein [unclassified Bradyrhizobium]